MRETWENAQFLGLTVLIFLVVSGILHFAAPAVLWGYQAPRSVVQVGSPVAVEHRVLLLMSD